MTSAIRIAVAAALSLTSITLAHGADVEQRQVVALADTSAVRWSGVDEITDRYAGRYVTADGQSFAITVTDDALTFEEPESWGNAILTLHALGAQTFATDDADVRVTFSLADDGEVRGASIVRGSEQALAATREALRGIVTILDTSEQIATAGLRRGVVTIVDVVNDVATSVVASNAVASAN